MEYIQQNIINIQDLERNIKNAEEIIERFQKDRESNLKALHIMKVELKRQKETMHFKELSTAFIHTPQYRLIVDDTVFEVNEKQLRMIVSLIIISSIPDDCERKLILDNSEMSYGDYEDIFGFAKEATINNLLKIVDKAINEYYIPKICIESI